MTDREVMQMALDALDYVGYVYTTKEENQEVEQAIEALRTALAQPKKEWVGLTDEEIAEGIINSWVIGQAFESAVWWAEEKLKEKNSD